MNNHDAVIAASAKLIAPNFAEFLHGDEAFVEALHEAASKYVAAQGLYSDEAETDIAMELVMRVTVLVD